MQRPKMHVGVCSYCRAQTHIFTATVSTKTWALLTWAFRPSALRWGDGHTEVFLTRSNRQCLCTAVCLLGELVVPSTRQRRRGQTRVWRRRTKSPAASLHPASAIRAPSWNSYCRLPPRIQPRCMQGPSHSGIASPAAPQTCWGSKGPASLAPGLLTRSNYFNSYLFDSCAALSSVKLGFRLLHFLFSSSRDIFHFNKYK